MTVSVKKIDVDASDTTTGPGFDSAVARVRREFAQEEFVQPVVVVDLTRVDAQGKPWKSATDKEREADGSDLSAQRPGGSGAGSSAVLLKVIGRGAGGDTDSNGEQNNGSAGGPPVETTTLDEGITVSRVTLPVTGGSVSGVDVLLVSTETVPGSTLVANLTDDTGRSTTVLLEVDDQGGVISEPALVVETDADTSDGSVAFGVVGEADADTGVRSLILIVPDPETSALAIAIANVSPVETINIGSDFTNGRIFGLGAVGTATRFGGAVSIYTGDTAVIVWVDAGRNVSHCETGEINARFGLIIGGESARSSVTSEVRAMTLIFSEGALTHVAIDGDTICDFDAFIRELVAGLNSSDDEIDFLVSLQRQGFFALKSTELSTTVGSEVDLIAFIATRGIEDPASRREVQRDQEREIEKRTNR